MERRCGYGEILAAAKGKKVLVWTCNTCARLCNGLGGEKAAEKLASDLREDGVDVMDVLSVSASCLMPTVRSKSGSVGEKPDMVISMTCDMGARNAGKAFCTEIFEPFATLGPGYLDDDGVPHLPDGTTPKR